MSDYTNVLSNVSFGVEGVMKKTSTGEETKVKVTDFSVPTVYIAFDGTKNNLLFHKDQHEFTPTEYTDGMTSFIIMGRKNSKILALTESSNVLLVDNANVSLIHRDIIVDGTKHSISASKYVQIMSIINS